MIASLRVFICGSSSFVCGSNWNYGSPQQNPVPIRKRCDCSPASARVCTGSFAARTNLRTAAFWEAGEAEPN